MSRVVVTGASGFVGRHLVDALSLDGREVVAALRECQQVKELQLSSTLRFDLNHPEDLAPEQLESVDCIYHLAACVHVMRGRPDDELRFSRLNARATEILAETAAIAGVRRLVYLSSIKVNGERTAADAAFTSQNRPAPEDAYGRSKWHAEMALMKVSQRTGLDVVVVRPPLIYGPNVGANFLRLLRLANGGWPLPFGSIDNRRSLVSIWNLVSLLLHVQHCSKAANGVWLVSDGDDVSTPRLLTVVAKALRNRAPPLVPVPIGVLRALAAVIGRRRELARLVDSLRVDASETQEKLNWKPPMGLDEGVERTVAWFKEAPNALG